MQNRCPVRNLGAAHHVDKSYLRTESLELPLSNDDNRVDRLLICAVFSTENGPL